MPTPRRIREATGRHRKLPLRNCQSAYRSQRGITSAQVDLRNLHHHEILQQNIVQTRLHQEILALEAAIDLADPNDEEIHHHRLELDLLEASLLTSEIEWILFYFWLEIREKKKEMFGEVDTSLIGGR